MLASELRVLAAGDRKSRKLAKVVVSLLANPIALTKLPEGDGAAEILEDVLDLDSRNFSFRTWEATLLTSESLTESPDIKVDEVKAEDEPDTEVTTDKLSKEASLGNLATALSISQSRSLPAPRLSGFLGAGNL